ncbi:EamA family transporter RarD [Ostreibacterium oceani]|uniref:EamA family transporter RarD n=1 Tax=Ostreibacterium oceani TaxID=2654998 RepID=A0A6N7EXQ5_9GAMM|nr:EamA family transporter RarD [Ostreibacterium oceani]MPV86320.1 EamA family transporter RarD [Ostreibacterium oceani]
MNKNTKIALMQALAAYGMWGIFPLYWYFLQHVPAIESIAHRIIWSFVLLIVVLTMSKKWQAVRGVFLQPRLLLALALTSLLVSGNWLLYIWAVTHQYVIESSLGYFINPVVNMLLGTLFLGERFRKWQYLALFFVLLGIAIISISYGRIPYIALGLAVSFALYALLRKVIAVASQPGLLIETGITLLPALIYLTYLGQSSAFVSGGWLTSTLLIGAGIVTIVPLILMNSALKGLTLTEVGLVQYLSPTIQFLLGLFLFKEPFSTLQLVSFCCIWLGLIIYTGERLMYRTPASDVD